MRINAYDLSKANSGWSSLTSKRIDCGSFTATGDIDPEIFLSFSRWFYDSIDRYLGTPEPVTHVAIERVMPGGKSKIEIIPGKADLVGGLRVKDFTNFETQAYLLGFRGIAMATVQGFGLPLYMPTVGEWRRSFYGKGVKPPPDRNTPAKRKTWWKHMAKRQCELLSIHVPDADAAEACGIGFWLRAQLQYERYAQGSMI
jgi:hypothetical protein